MSIERSNMLLLCMVSKLVNMYLCVLVTNYAEIPTIDAVSEINFSFLNIFRICLHLVFGIRYNYRKITEMKTRTVCLRAREYRYSLS